MDKADELVAKARKRMASWGLFSSTNKYEDAAEMLEKAANLYKASKKCVAPVTWGSLPVTRSHSPT